MGLGDSHGGHSVPQPPQREVTRERLPYEWRGPAAIPLDDHGGHSVPQRRKARQSFEHEENYWDKGY